MAKLILYLLVIPIVVFSIDSININKIFKKNANYYAARVFYIILVVSISYIIVSFINDFLGVLL